MLQAAPRRDAPEFCLQDLVSDIMVATGYQQEITRMRLVALSATNPSLHDALIDLGAQQAMRTYRLYGRRSPSGVSVEYATSSESSSETVTNPPRPPSSRPAAAPPSDETIFRRVEQRLWWDRYCLFGGKPLREATPDDLRLSIEKRRKQAAGNIRNADFEASVCRRLTRFGPNARVVDALTIEKVEALRERHLVEDED